MIGLLATDRQIAVAQTATGQTPFSIGQPRRLEYDVSVLAPVRGDGGFDPRVSVAAYRPVRNPLSGLFGVTGEIYFGGAHAGGARVLADAKSLALAGGVDWDVAARRADPVLSYRSAIRRGGLFGYGSMARVDWIPTRHSLAVGATLPLRFQSAGRTRPRETNVSLAAACQPPEGVPASLVSEAIANRLRASATAIGSFSNAYTPRASSVISGTRGTYIDVMREYDRAIRHLFEVGGIDSSTAAEIAAHGREILLDRVIIPVDSLFGRAKSNSRELEPLTCAAAARFDRWITDSAQLTPARRSLAVGAFNVWLDVIEQVYRDLAVDARDSRLLWLPLDLALQVDDFDEQAEVDALMARVVGHPFTDQNALTYLRSADLPLEIARSIYATRRYHVLWTHDFTGRRESGATDQIGYSMVADAYLPALTAAVKRYDTTGVLPTYIILQDQYFYEARGNRLWMAILEDPLHASPRLRDDAERESRLRARQQELRAAVAGSARLQRDAARSGNAGAWLRKIVKVHVNIVEPGNFAFRSHRIVPGIPFTPDHIMRDHRKLVFYDVNESDPYEGAMLLMGVGIGEHYASETWEDRGYRVRGPATLEARRAARDALRGNGFSERDIPEPLRPVASIDQALRRSDVGDYVGRALQVHNEVGFGRKQSSIARAMLYNLAPPGSVIVAPDPMWLSDTWAGMLVGAAARGCRVFIVAPSEANAPSPQAPLLAVQHTILSRVLHLRDSLNRQMRAAGGELRVGIFAARAAADDGPGRATEVSDGLARSPWLRELIPFDARTLSVLRGAEEEVANGTNATTIARDEVPRAPQLHQKSQMIARPGAIAALVRQPNWDVTLARAISAQAKQTVRFAEQIGYANPDVDTTATRRTDALLRGYERTLPETDRRRLSFYFSLGSQNQDPRGIVSDAEATMIVSGVEASAGLVDLFFLMARSTWIDSETALSSFVPPRSRFVGRIAWLLRAAF